LIFLVDSSVWIDHFRKMDPALERALVAGDVLGHPFVTGEIAMGSLEDRQAVIESLQHLPQAQIAEDEEVLGLVEGRRLFSLGLGWIDAHLLASTLLTRDARLWTRDRRLRAAAQELDVAAAR
jgi:predicted nucleic acid-binding protein